MATEIPLTRGLVTIVDDADAEWLRQWRWITICSRPGRYYAGRREGLACILMHRAILQPAPDLHTDHIDNDGLNNQRSNLRVVTRAQNAQNARAKSHNSTGYKGVSPAGKRFIAQIMANRVHYKLGIFDTAEEAYAAYCAAAAELHGDFARLA